MKGISAILFVMLLIVPLIGVQAQGRDDLSDEEQALLDRFFEVSDSDEEYTSYALTSDETMSVTLIVDLGIQVEASQSSNRSVEAYIVRDGDLENAAGSTTVEYTSENPDGDLSYSIEADVVFLDEMLYVDAAFVDSEGDVGEIEEGWQVYDSADAIPEVLDELQLDNLFDEDDGEEIFERRDLIESAVTRVLAEEDELEDGRPVEVIILVFEGDGAAAFFSAIAEDDESGNSFVEILYNSEGEGEVLIGIAIDENEQLVGMAMQFSLGLEDLDLTPFEIEGFPEGATLTASVESTRVDVLSDIDGDFDQIVAPEE